MVSSACSWHASRWACASALAVYQTAPSSVSTPTLRPKRSDSAAASFSTLAGLRQVSIGTRKRKVVLWPSCRHSISSACTASCWATPRKGNTAATAGQLPSQSSPGTGVITYGPLGAACLAARCGITTAGCSAGAWGCGAWFCTAAEALSSENSVTQGGKSSSGSACFGGGAWRCGAGADAVATAGVSVGASSHGAGALAAAGGGATGAAAMTGATTGATAATGSGAAGFGAADGADGLLPG